MACMTADDVRLVHFVIGRYWKYYLGNEDVFQAGCLAMCECAEKLGDKFSESSTYVVAAINHAIINYFHKENKHSKVMSYDTTVKSGNDDTGTVWIDNFESPPIYPYEIDLPDYLNDVEKEIISGLAAGYTMQEIGDTLGFSRQRVSERKKAAMKKLIRHDYVSKEEADERRRKRRGKADSEGTGIGEQDV